MFGFLFSKTFLIQLSIAAIVVFFAIIGTYFYLKKYARLGEAITVPALIEFDIVEAESVLKKSNLQLVVVDSLYMPEKRGGIILDVNPPEFSSVKSGREIYLTISRYKTPQTTIPNVVDQTMAIATNKLTRRGFKIGKLIPVADPCEGCAIGLEIDGKRIEVDAPAPKGSIIDIIVGESGSDASVAVPILYGLSRGEAEKMLIKFNLNVGAVVYTDCENEGDSAASKIYWQSIKPLFDAQMGDPINVKLSPNLGLIPPVNLDSIKASIL